MLRRTFLPTIAALSLQAAPPRGKGWKPLFDGKSLEGWRSEKDQPQKWSVENNELFNGPMGKVNNIFTDQKFADLELYLEFQVPKASNSGVYLHGLYEVQIFDSFGKEKISTQDSGSIYHQWIDGKAVGGSVARVNASRAPGVWQDFHLRFRAPRFDAQGKRISPARFEFVRYNGQLVQENADCLGPTRAHMEIAEAARNPIMLQGDHGPVRFRNLLYKEI